jgi:sialate O-acetylesterase
MELPLAGWGRINNYQAEIAAANYPQIRFLHVNTASSLQAIDDDLKSTRDGWQICSPSTIDNFSSVAYFFGRDLFQNLNIPIGLINSSWGGTFVEAWMSSETLGSIPAFAEGVQKIKNGSEAEITAEYEKRLKAWPESVLAVDSGYENKVPVWANTQLDENAWKTMELPGEWERKGLFFFDGVVWFRKTVNIPAAWSGKDLELHFDAIEDDDIAYFNGEKVGETKGNSAVRNYKIPANLVKAGKAVITVRVFDLEGPGGITGAPESMSLLLASNKDNQPIALAGEWKYRTGVNFRQFPAPKSTINEPNRYTVLYNAMINPLINFTMQGVIWYQGETNVGRAEEYKTLFPLMIQDWRKAWKRDFPFYFVQLANYQAQKPEPGESDWAALRDAQAQALNLDNTGMAVAIEIGDARDIHPKNKQDVGLRLALNALAKTYKQNVAFSGPTYESYKIEGNKIRIHFTNTNGGLKTKDGSPVKGFAIAGPDDKFYWADAVIEGNEIVVNAPEVKFPLSVRYAWADNPVCNLYNGADLPAAPFKTDFKY